MKRFRFVMIIVFTLTTHIVWGCEKVNTRTPVGPVEPTVVVPPVVIPEPTPDYTLVVDSVRQWSETFDTTRGIVFMLFYELTVTNTGSDILVKNLWSVGGRFKYNGHAEYGNNADHPPTLASGETGVAEVGFVYRSIHGHILNPAMQAYYEDRDNPGPFGLTFTAGWHYYPEGEEGGYFWPRYFPIIVPDTVDLTPQFP